MTNTGTQDKNGELRFYNRMYSNLKGADDGHCILYGYDDIYRCWAEKLSRGLLLDVGSGTGKHSLNLSQMGFPVVGIDLSLTGIRAARAAAQLQGQRIHFIQGDVEHLPFKDGAFHVAFCALILHHFPDRRAVIREIARVTRAHLVAFETNALEPLTLLKFNLLNRFVGISRMTSNQRALFPGRLRTQLTSLGFDSFSLSWLDIHRGPRGLAATLLACYRRLSAILPRRFRSNKFVLTCRRQQGPHPPHSGHP